jgi:hypothetical protein
VWQDQLDYPVILEVQLVQLALEFLDLEVPLELLGRLVQRVVQET